MFQQLSFLDLFRARRKSVRPKTRRSIEPNSQELHDLWCRIRREWFPDRPEIERYQVRWSNRRQKRTLAVCYPENKLVRVARELNVAEHSRWLTPLLYHEMCHAVIGMRRRQDNKRSWHGPEFRALERQHPEIAALDAWIKCGGWLRAVRSDRSRRSHLSRRQAAA